MKASELKKGDKVKVDFTDSVCEVIDIDYSYGRTSYMLSYFNGSSMENTSIAPHTDVKLVKEK